MLLKGKNILITGASKGIGYATALKLAKEGATLLLVSRNLDTLKILAKKIEVEYKTSVHVFKADIRNKSEIKAIFDELNKSKILVDVLVNNAGIMIDSGLFTLSEELLKDTFEINVFAAVNFTQMALKSIIKSKGGSIIFVSSVVGTKGSSGQSVYSASKSALIGFTKSLSKELGSLNIRVNAVAPGFIQTDLTNNYSESQVEKIIQSISMKRLGHAEDVANVIIFLSSDLSAYVTGQIIEVDGGMVI